VLSREEAEPATQQVHVHGAYVADGVMSTLASERSEARQVSTIREGRMRRSSAFGRQVAKESLDGVVERHGQSLARPPLAGPVCALYWGPVKDTLRRALTELRRLWDRARSERASPPQVGLAVAVGVFAGVTPAVGFHGWIAVGLATVLRLNRLFAFLGSRISNFVLLPWIVLAEIEIAHRWRTGAFLPMAPHDALAQGPQLLVDWALGTLPIGAALATTLGVLAYLVARRRATPRTLAPHPPRSSECPP
jgi:uncharacterized protein (DUF2062 family)